MKRQHSWGVGWSRGLVCFEQGRGKRVGNGGRGSRGEAGLDTFLMENGKEFWGGKGAGEGTLCDDVEQLQFHGRWG